MILGDEMKALAQKPMQTTNDSYVWGKFGGSSDDYTRVGATRADDILRILCDRYKERCTPAYVAEVLLDESLGVLKASDIVKADSRVVLVPLFHEVTFSFRTLSVDQSLRLLAKEFVSKSTIPISGNAKRISGIDVQVTARSAYKEPLDELYARFSNPVGVLKRQANIAVDPPVYGTGAGVMDKHFFNSEVFIRDETCRCLNSGDNADDD